MNDLIKITTNNQGKQVVSARELYLGLGLNKTQWARWYQTNIKNNDFFSENYDWIGVRHNVEGNEVQDFAISLEFAKHIAMMARTPKSHEYRNYFIRCEEKLNESELNTSQLSPELQMFNQMFKAIANNELEQKRLKAEMQETKKEIKDIREVVSLNSTDWRKDTSALISKIALKLGGFEYINKVRNESYERLEKRIPIKLETRLTNKRRRMADEGVCKSKRDKLNYLDVIADDKKALEVYLAVIKEMAISNGVGI